MCTQGRNPNAHILPVVVVVLVIQVLTIIKPHQNYVLMTSIQKKSLPYQVVELKIVRLDLDHDLYP